MKTFNCKCGKIIKVDDYNAHYFSNFQYKICCHGKYLSIDLHNGEGQFNVARLFIGVPDGMEPDHIDGDFHNNLVSNLRPASQAQNAYNRGMARNNTSGYKGVTWDKDNNKWIAQIKVNKKHIKLGRFVSSEEAAEAYNKAAFKYFGTFARPNVILTRN